MTSSSDELFEAFRDVPKPASAKGCSQGCCMEDDEVLALLNADQRTLTVRELMDYVDGAFMTLSNVPEFTYLLPAMLNVWSHELFQSAPTGYTERFHAALGRRYDGVARLAPSFIVTQLAPSLQAAVTGFMQHTLLRRLGVEFSVSVHGKSPTHYGMMAVTTAGALVPDMASFWKSWWAFPTPGHAIAAVQYASCVICGHRDNPIFAPWDRKQGGGATCLWEYDSLNDEEWVWLEANRHFLSQTLSITYLREQLRRAAQQLQPAQQTSVEVLQQRLVSDPTMVELRIQQLLDMLQTANSRVRLEASLQYLQER